MKKLFFCFGIAGIALFPACKDGTETTTTTDSTGTVNNATTSSEPSSITTTRTVNIRPDVSYVDLKSGKQIKLRLDTVTHYVINVETSEPVSYYIDPSTSDTFDMSGVNVSNALIRSSSGVYTTDESRLKMKTQSDGDIKTKDEAGNKMKIEQGSDEIKMKGSDGSKEKMDGNKYKSKTDTSKMKSNQ